MIVDGVYWTRFSQNLFKAIPKCLKSSMGQNQVIIQPTFVPSSSSTSSSLRPSSAPPLPSVCPPGQAPSSCHQLLGGGQGPIIELVSVVRLCLWSIGCLWVGAWGGQWTQIELHVKNKRYFLEQSLINSFVEFFPTWGEWCPTSSSPSAASSSPSCVGLPSSSASSCSSPHPWSHAVIEHVGFVFEVPRPRPASNASPSYLPQLLVNLKALQTKLIHLLWCEGFK